MSLEKEINQSKFRNDYQKAVINIVYTFNWMSERMKNFFERFDITSQQFNILRILRRAGTPISTLQIRERMLDKMSDTSRIVDRLIKKSLVKKNISKNDKRLVDVTITDKGKKLLQKADKYQDEIDFILGNLSQTDVKSLNKLLDKIRQKD